MGIWANQFFFFYSAPPTRSATLRHASNAARLNLIGQTSSHVVNGGRPHLSHNDDTITINLAAPKIRMKKEDASRSMYEKLPSAWIQVQGFL